MKEVTSMKYQNRSSTFSWMQYKRCSLNTMNFLAAFLLFGGVHACYYNHELAVGCLGDTFTLKWRDASSGPLPGIGFEIAYDDLIFELESEDLTAVSIGDKKYEFSVPFTFNEVDPHGKSLCDWGYGCAHCQHVGEDACSRRLYAISMVSEILRDPTQVLDELPDEVLDAFDTIITGLKRICTERFESGQADEKYLTNDIVEACEIDCLSV